MSNVKFKRPLNKLMMRGFAALRRDLDQICQITESGQKLERDDNKALIEYMSLIHKINTDNNKAIKELSDEEIKERVKEIIETRRNFINQ